MDSCSAPTSLEQSAMKCLVAARGSFIMKRGELFYLFNVDRAVLTGVPKDVVKSLISREWVEHFSAAQALTISDTGHDAVRGWTA